MYFLFIKDNRFDGNRIFQICLKRKAKVVSSEEHNLRRTSDIGLQIDCQEI